MCVIEIFQGGVIIASFSQLSPLFPNDILLTLLSFANGSVGESCAQQLCTSPLAVNLNQQVCTCHGSKCAVCLSLGKSIRKYLMVEAFFLKVHAWWGWWLSKFVRLYFYFWLEELFLLPSETQGHLRSGLNHVICPVLVECECGLRLHRVAGEYFLTLPGDNTYLPTYLRTYVRTYIHTYIHTHCIFHVDLSMVYSPSPSKSFLWSSYSLIKPGGNVGNYTIVCDQYPILFVTFHRNISFPTCLRTEMLRGLV